MDAGRMRVAAAIVCLLPVAAGAHSFATDLTVGPGYLGAGLIGDLELRPDETFLTLSYSGVRPGVGSALSHQLGIGADQQLGLHWFVSGALTWSPRSINRISLGPDLVFRATNASVGASATLAYQSMGFDFYEYVADVSLSATAYQFTRQLDGAVQTRLQREGLSVLRPALSYIALFDIWTELSLRASYSLYSDDPLTVGRFTDEQLQRLQATLPLGPGQAALLQQSLLTADAVSGLQTAPAWFDLRTSLGHRFSEEFRASAAYAFIRYVPSQGVSHVPSLRAVWSPWSALDLIAAAALQVDAPQDAPRTSALLVTVGAQVRFGERADSVADE